MELKVKTRFVASIASCHRAITVSDHAIHRRQRVDNIIMAPSILYRVEDKDSRAQYSVGGGIYAEDRNTPANIRGASWGLYNELKNHIDWKSRTPTVFISAYYKEEVALREAHRRVRDGKEEVVVYQIDIGKRDRRVEYREMRRLATKLRLEIPDCAWNNSKYEYIFLYHVPESAVVGWVDFW